MTSVLIVDDEVLVRQSIINRVDWEKLNCEVVGEADNGQTALDFLLKNNQIKIIITDIKMPIIDGIELIKKVKLLYPHIEFIILSGFPDFQYAKTALQLGVKNFIEKPININELSSTVKKITSSQKCSYAQLIELSDELGLFEYKNYCMVAYQYGKTKLFDFTNYDIEALLNVKSHSFIVPYLPQCDFLLMCSNEPFDVAQIKLLEIFNSNMYFDKVQEHFIFIQSGSIEHYTQIYHKLLIKLKSKIFKYGMDFSNLEERKYNAKINCLKSYLYNKKTSEFLEILSDILFDYDNINLSILENLIYQTTHEIHKLYPSDYEINNYLQELTSPYFIINTYSFKECMGKIMQTFKNIFSIIEKQSTKNDLLENICEYINNNYATDITLESISNDFYISPSYLSSIFKKNIGTNFTNYIERIRINHSKELLKDPKLSINDVAISIGYSDPNYFSKVFKKYENLSPSQYKKSL